MRKNYINEKNANTSFIGPLKNGDWAFSKLAWIAKIFEANRVGANLP